MELVEREILVPDFSQEDARTAFEGVGALLSKYEIRGRHAIALWNNYNALVALGLGHGELWKGRDGLVKRSIRFVELGDEGADTFRAYNAGALSEMSEEDRKIFSLGMSVFYSFAHTTDGGCPMFPELHQLASRFGETVPTDSTRRIYARAVLRFLEHCDENRTDPDDVTEDDVVAYLEGLRAEKSEAVVRQAAAALRRFMTFQEGERAA